MYLNMQKRGGHTPSTRLKEQDIEFKFKQHFEAEKEMGMTAQVMEGSGEENSPEGR